MACRATNLLLRLAKYNPAPLDITPTPRAANKPHYTYDDTPHRHNQTQAQNFDPYTPYTDDEAATHPSTNAAPSTAPAEPPRPAIASEVPTQSSSTPINKANDDHFDEEPTGKADSNAAFNLEDEDPDLDLDLDSDLDLVLDFENDPTLTPDFTNSQRSNLPSLIQQLRHLAATHPP
jgi:hypothetical protein